MKLLAGISIISTLCLSMRQCGEDDVRDDIPECVKNSIEALARYEVWDPPAKVYSYIYNGKKVYFVPERCCDFPSKLFDENCNYICAPSGGFSGGGDGKCKDFFDMRTGETLIWEDPRKP